MFNIRVLGTSDKMIKMEVLGTLEKMLMIEVLGTLDKTVKKLDLNRGCAGSCDMCFVLLDRFY